jgi:exopolysaccharide production repressor protein
MGAPRVFVGMFCTLIVFSIAMYFINGSIVTTLLDSISAAIILQFGYFAVVVAMIWRASEARHAALRIEMPNGGSLAPVEELAPQAVTFDQSSAAGSDPFRF